MQSLRRNSNTDWSLCSIGIAPIVTFVDLRKLHFFGQMCRLPNKYIAKQVFNHRLCRYIDYDNQYREVIPEMYRLLSKYGLLDILIIY